MVKSVSLLQKQASEFRRNHDIGSNDAIRFKSLLQNLNVISNFQALSSDFSGMAIKISTEDVPDIRLMMVNSNHSLGKQHFTICHELYHLYVQENFTSMTCNTGQFDKKSGVEYDADRFASYLLLPEQGVMNLIPNEELGKKNKITIPTLLKIEQYYSCSRTALWTRLVEMELISRDTYDHYCSYIKRSAIAHGYTTSLYEKGNENLALGNYGSLARKLLEEGKISESHYLSLLRDWGVPSKQLENLFSENPDGEKE